MKKHVFMADDPAALQSGAIADANGLAVEPRPAAGESGEAFVENGIVHDTGYRLPVLGQPRGNREMRPLLEKGGRSIDRIHNEHPLRIQARKVLAGFLGKPAVMR